MFVRDGSNSPTEISKVFVRNTSGTATEIAKIYVRNQNGEPVLVFDNTIIIPPNFCGSCVTGQVYYYQIGTTSSTTIETIPYITRAKTTTSCTIGPPPNPVGIPQPLGGTNITNLSLNKNYWSKVGSFYDIAKTNPNSVETVDRYYTTLTQNLQTDCGSCFCNWLSTSFTTVSTAESVPFEYYSRLGTAFENVVNYPPIPGYIVIDYTTYYVRDSFISSIANGFLQGIWNNHGQTIERTELPWMSFSEFDDIQFPLVPNGAYDQSISPTSTAETRADSIYPVDDRVVLYEYKKPASLNNPVDALKAALLAKCGQEYCYKVYGEYFFNFIISDCESSETIFDNVCCAFINPPPPGITPEECVGDITLGTWGGDCITDINGQPTGNTYCPINNCTDLVDWNAGPGEPPITPIPIMLHRFQTGTGRTQPIILPDAATTDCCSSCFYGAVPSDIPTSLDMCREIYQIPPINSELPHASRLDFFNIKSSFDMSVEGIAGSKMLIRYTLPAYAKLHNNLKGKVIKFNQSTTAIANFIGSGPSGWNFDGGTTLTNEELSVYKALSGFFGFNLLTTEDVFQKDRIYLSSNSFYYEENRYESISVGGNNYLNPGLISQAMNNNTSSVFVLSGIQTATLPNSLGQYPLIWWSFNGYPTEEQTHYITIEYILGPVAERCNAAIGGNSRSGMIGNQQILIDKIKSITFNPIHFNCPNLQGQTVIDDSTGQSVPVTSQFRHPIFENYLLSSNLLKSTNVVNGSNIMTDFNSGFPDPTNPEARGGNGFLDFYSNNLNTITQDQGGSSVGLWNTTSPLQTNSSDIPNYLIFKGPKSSTNSLTRAYYSCLRLPPIKTYKEFLEKYYPTKVNI